MVSVSVSLEAASVFTAFRIVTPKIVLATSSMPITSAIIARWIFRPSDLFFFIRCFLPARARGRAPHDIT